VNKVTFSYHGANGPESSVTPYFEKVRQLAVPVERRTASVFGTEYRRVALGAMCVIYDGLVERCVRPSVSGMAGSPVSRQTSMSVLLDAAVNASSTVPGIGHVARWSSSSLSSVVSCCLS